MASKTMEMVWSSSSLGKMKQKNLYYVQVKKGLVDAVTGKSGWLFTGVNYNLYQPPPGFCFDILCSDLPLIDNPKSKEFNIDQRVPRYKNAEQVVCN